jgi:hypothetical protein
MFGFARFVAKAFIRSSETTPPNIAGTPFLLPAIRAAEWTIAKLRRRVIEAQENLGALTADSLRVRPG